MNQNPINPENRTSQLGTTAALATHAAGKQPSAQFSQTKAKNKAGSQALSPSSKRQSRGANVSFLRLAKSEWTKFRTVRGNLVGLFVVMALTVAFAALVTAGYSAPPSGQTASQNPGVEHIDLALGAFNLTLIGIAILAVVTVTADYTSGVISTWFSAAPDRVRVLCAKTAVIGLITFGAILLTGLLSLLLTGAMLPSGFETASLGSAVAIRALVGLSFYAAMLAMISVSIGFIVRSTAAGALLLAFLLLVLPVGSSLLPEKWAFWVGRKLPSNAGIAVQKLEQTVLGLSAQDGVIVLACWLLATFALALLLLKRRDA